MIFSLHPTICKQQSLLTNNFNWGGTGRNDPNTLEAFHKQSWHDFVITNTINILKCAHNIFAYDTHMSNTMS